jgi:hypothetical protein
MERSHTGINVHDVKSVEVVARDIQTFWTIQFTSRDRADGQFTVDLYVHSFDADEMEKLASSLAAGAKSIRELAKTKAPCKHPDLNITEVATCADCNETVDIFGED